MVAILFDTVDSVASLFLGYSPDSTVKESSLNPLKARCLPTWYHSWLICLLDSILLGVHYPLVNQHNYGRSPFLMDKLTI